MRQKAMLNRRKEDGCGLCVCARRADRESVEGMDPAGTTGPDGFWAGIPLWVLVAVVGVLALLVFWFLAKAVRILAAIVAVAVLVAATWMAWQHLFG